MFINYKDYTTQQDTLKYYAANIIDICITSQFCLSRTDIIETGVLIFMGFPKLYLVPEKTYGTPFPLANVRIWLIFSSSPPVKQPIKYNFEDF